jgi:hypothetical protein
MRYTDGEYQKGIFYEKGQMMTHEPDSLRHLVSVISGGTYSLSLATVDPTQILYNGKFSYLTSYQNPKSGAWCHLLLLRSKNRFSKQLLAILTQTPDCSVSIVNTIEDIATFTLNFFNRFHPSLLRKNEDEDEIHEMTPDNTIFVEYLPAGCFGPDSGHKDDTFAVMNFSWEEVPFGQQSSYQEAKSSDAMWRHARIDAINDLIARL